MNEQKAKTMAAILGGSYYNSGGGVWLVVFVNKLGRYVVISDEVMAEFKSQASFERGDRPLKEVVLYE